MHAYSRTAYAPFHGKATEVRTYSMLIAGDSNGRVYPEKLFKVVGTYAAYVLADSAFARLDHGSGEQHIACTCATYALHTHAPPRHYVCRRAAAQGSACPHVGGARRRRGSRG